jgi:hypothetical protein
MDIKTFNLGEQGSFSAKVGPQYNYADIFLFVCVCVCVCVCVNMFV